MARIVLVFVLSLLVCAQAWKVTLFGTRGNRISLSGAECMDLGDKFSSSSRVRVASVNAHGGCVRLYESADCDGEYKAVFNKKSPFEDLTFIGFNDHFSSVGPCPPDPEVAPFVVGEIVKRARRLGERK